MRKIITSLLLLIAFINQSQTVLFKQLEKTTPGNIYMAVGTGTNGVITPTASIPLSKITGTTTLLPTTTSLTINGVTKTFTSTPSFTTIGLSSLSATSPLFYNNSTGVFTVQPASTSQAGVLSSTDWNTFNGKQTAINGTGFVKATGTTISYDNSTYLTAAGDVTATATQTLTNKTIGSPTLTGTSTFSNTNYNGVVNQYAGASAASSSTVDLSTVTGNYIHITGTVTINSFGTVQAGAERILVFDAACSITTSTNIILPNSLSITTNTNDIAVFRSDGSGVWRLISYLSNDDSWIDYTPTTVGFSALPTLVCRYKLTGKTLNFIYAPTTNGTSNSTSYTITIPFNAKQFQGFAACFTIDNGTQAFGGYVQTSAGSNVVTLSEATSSWQASGNKRCAFTGTFEIQ